MYEKYFAIIRLLVLIFTSISLLTSCTRSKKNLNVELVKKMSGKALWKHASLANGALAQVGEIKIFPIDLAEDTLLKDLHKKQSLISSKIKEKVFSKDYYGKLVLETKIYHRKLEIIEKLVKERALHNEAKKLKITLKEYIEKYVYSQFKEDLVESEKKSFLAENPVPKNVKVNDWIEQAIFNKKRERSLNYILEKYILDLPIKISLVVPSGQLKFKDNLTPFWGSKNSPHKVIVYSGSNSHSERILLKNLKELLVDYKNLYIGYRPIVSEKHSFERQRTLFQFCVWKNEPKRFWSFLENTVDIKMDKAMTLLNVAAKMDLKRGELERCVEENPFSEAFDYHHKYNQYLGIQSGPVVYINGEVLEGVVTIEAIKRVLNRQIEAKTAGVW